MEMRKHTPKIRLTKKEELKIAPEVEPIELPDLDLRITLGDIHNLPLFKRSWKMVANFLTNRFVGIKLFTVNKSQSIMDWVIRIIQLIITKLKGKDNE